MKDYIYLEVPEYTNWDLPNWLKVFPSLSHMSTSWDFWITHFIHIFIPKESSLADTFPSARLSQENPKYTLGLQRQPQWASPNRQFTQPGIPLIISCGILFPGDYYLLSSLPTHSNVVSLYIYFAHLNNFYHHFLCFQYKN